MGDQKTGYSTCGNTPLSWIYLSHFLSEETPGFGGGLGFHRTIKKSISAGDSSNSFEFRMSNHHGTHMDLPKHFVDTGKTMNDFSAGEFVFSKIGLSKSAPSENELLTSKHLEDGISADVDLLLFKTDWSRFRAQEKYWKNNPGFSSSMANELRKKFPKLRAIGFDFISLTAFQHREEGRTAHREYLGGERPLLIIEDMNLTGINTAPHRVIVAPLLIDKADGGPVTVMAEI
jgi:arylformamidase